MSNLYRLVMAGIVSAAVATAAPAFAQLGNAPAGGVATTTAPGNAESTPAGGTGTLSSTRVGPGGSAASVASPNTAPRRSAKARKAAPRKRVAKQTGTQSQQGLDNAAATR